MKTDVIVSNQDYDYSTLVLHNNDHLSKTSLLCTMRRIKMESYKKMEKYLMVRHAVNV